MDCDQDRSQRRNWRGGYVTTTGGVCLNDEEKGQIGGSNVVWDARDDGNAGSTAQPALVASGEPRRLLASTPFQSSSGECRPKGNNMKSARSPRTAAIRGISVRKDAEKHLAQMEARYRGLLEAAPDAMVVVNQAGDIVLLNVQAEKQFGYPRDELVGQKVTNIIPEGFAERLVADDLRSAAEALAQQIGTGIELIGLRKDGSEFPIEIMLSPLESAEGILVTAAIRNISVRKEESTRVERLKDDFVSTVSHELRTPLTSIAGSLALLVGNAGGQLPESASRLLAIAYTNSQRLVRLINDILDVEKIESGKVIFAVKRIDVRAIIEQAIEANRGFAEGFGVRIKLDAPSGIFEMAADPDRLVQVVTNLLSNAIKFSPRDQEVVVSIKRRKGTIRISVRDRGSGIPDDFKQRIL